MGGRSGEQAGGLFFWAEEDLRKKYRGVRRLQKEGADWWIRTCNASLGHAQSGLGSGYPSPHLPPPAVREARPSAAGTGTGPTPAGPRRRQAAPVCCSLRPRRAGGPGGRQALRQGVPGGQGPNVSPPLRDERERRPRRRGPGWAEGGKRGELRSGPRRAARPLAMHRPWRALSVGSCGGGEGGPAGAGPGPQASQRGRSPALAAVSWCITLRLQQRAPGKCTPGSALPEHFEPYLAVLRKASPTELLNVTPSASITDQKNSHLALQARDASSPVALSRRTDFPVNKPHTP